MKLEQIDDFLNKLDLSDEESAIAFLAEQLQAFADEIDPTDDDDADGNYGNKPGNGKFEMDSIVERSVGHDFEVRRFKKIDNPISTWSWAGAFEVIYPNSLLGAVEAVKYALSQNKKLKCLGTKYSFSLICETKDIYIDLSKSFEYNPKKHNKTVRTLDTGPVERLKENVDAGNYFNAPAGMPVNMINHILCPDDKKDEAIFGHKRMYNMAGVSLQTLAGAISTGTHGTGGKYTAIHDTVRSLEIVAGDGTVYRVEPKDGITDPAKHKAYYDNHPEEVPVVLLQDDDKFYAALVNMGCFGILYSIIIEVTDMSYMHQEVSYQKYSFDEAFIKKISKGVLPKNSGEEYFYSLLFNPYKIKKDQPVSYLYKETKLTESTTVKGGAKRRRLWPTFAAKLGVAARVIRHIANSGKFPKKGFIESSLKAQNDIEQKGGGYTNLSYKVWNGGLGKLQSFGVAIEFAIPVHQLEIIIPPLLQKLAAIGEDGNGFYLNAPISLRFARPSKAYLANNYYLDGDGNEVKEWCHFEIIRVNGKSKADDRRELELLMDLQQFFSFHKARPHWGLNFEYHFSVPVLKQLYPKFDQWLEAYQFFNSTGVFSNEFTKRMGIDSINDTTPDPILVV